MTRTVFSVTIAGFISALCVACDRSPASSNAPRESTTGVYALGPDESGPGDASTGGAADQGGAGDTGDAGATEGRITFGGFSAPVPPDWVAETPTSSMRAVQMVVPGVDGAGDAALVVYPGIGGTIGNNITRWVGQFTSETGGPVEPRVEEMTVGNVRITTVTLTGTFSGGMTPADGGPGKTMIQSLLQSPGDTHFITVRLLGPTSTVEANREEFQALLAGLR